MSRVEFPEVPTTRRSLPPFIPSLTSNSSDASKKGYLEISFVGLVWCYGIIEIHSLGQRGNATRIMYFDLWSWLIWGVMVTTLRNLESEALYFAKCG
jgi:hypothetical protein